MAENDTSDTKEWELVPSELDEATHAELRLLYDDSSKSVRFAKAQQWKTLGATLLIFLILILIVQYIFPDRTFAKSVVGFSFIISAGALYTLFIYQAWQGTEREKIEKITGNFSNLARDVVRIKSKMEADIHRFTLLGFMIVAIVLGNAVLVLVLSRLNR